MQAFHHSDRGSAALRSVRPTLHYQNHNLGWHEVPQAVGHPRRTEKPPGTPSGRRLRLEIAPSPVERLFPPSGGVSRGSVRVGGETFLLPSYGFSFGYKRKGVSIAPPAEARRNIVGHKYALSKATVMRTRILSVTPINPLGVTAPLMNKGSQENGVNAVTGRRYNPSVKPTACQLPLHSWLSSAASGGYSEKGKPLPSASARANSRSTSG